MTDTIIRREGDAACGVRQIDSANRTIRFLAQSTKMAGDRLVILAAAGKKYGKEFMRNPIVVPYHKMIAWDDVTPVVIGNVIKDEFEPEGRVQTVRFATSELAEQWWHLYAVDKVMRMVSIGWYYDGEIREEAPDKMIKLLKKNGITLSDAEINQLEGVISQYKQRDLSLVPIGADPDAMQHSADAGNGVAQDLVRGFEHTDGLWVARTTPPTVPVGGTPEASADTEMLTTIVGHIHDMSKLITDMTKQVGELATAMDNEPEAEEHSQEPAGPSGGAGEADAPTDDEPDAVSPYRELLDITEMMDSLPVTGTLPTDLMRQAQSLAEQDKPEKGE